MLNKTERKFNPQYLQKRMKDLGLNQTELGKRLGFSSGSAVGFWLNGKTTPTEENLQKLVTLGFRRGCLVHDAHPKANIENVMVDVTESDSGKILVTPAKVLKSTPPSILSKGKPVPKAAVLDDSAAIRAILDGATPENAYSLIQSLKKLF